MRCRRTSWPPEQRKNWRRASAPRWPHTLDGQCVETAPHLRFPRLAGIRHSQLPQHQEQANGFQGGQVKTRVPRAAFEQLKATLTVDKKSRAFGALFPAVPMSVLQNTFWSNPTSCALDPMAISFCWRTSLLKDNFLCSLWPRAKILAR